MKLKEKIVKEALAKLNWTQIKDHFDEIGLDKEVLEVFLEHMLRDSRIIMNYPNPKREAVRVSFFESLKKHTENSLGKFGVDAIEKVVNQIERFENGYRGILKLLDLSKISHQPPKVRISAYIHRAVDEYIHLVKLVNKEFMSRQIPPSIHGSLQMPNREEPLNPDGVIGTIVETLTMSLIMEAFKNKFIDENDIVIIPKLHEIDEDLIFQAGLTQLLAVYWRWWRRTEERARFLGCNIKDIEAENFPKWVPSDTQKLTIFESSIEDLPNFIANERLDFWLAQNYFRLITESTVSSQNWSINQKTQLPPNGFVSVEEAHAAVSLREILSYDIFSDKDQPEGLRLIEWLRGYSVLKALAEERNGDRNQMTSLMTIISSEELQAFMQNCGLTKNQTEIFIRAVTLRTSSRDLFDTPLIKIEDGSYILFAPGLISVNLAKIVLSNLSNAKVSFQRKGKAFETEILNFFDKQNLVAKRVKTSIDREEYEFDAVMTWGDYIFIFECKNRSLSNNQPICSYYFNLEMVSSAKQVLRLANCIKTNPERFNNLLNTDVTSKTIIPCVLNALPFSIPGNENNVYFLDASGLKRFFQERYVNFISPHLLEKDRKFIHRSAVHSLWSGDEPSPEDFIRHLEDPFQFNLMMSHTQIYPKVFHIDQFSLIVTEEFIQTPITLESLSELVGVSHEKVSSEHEAVFNIAKKLRELNKKEP
jgi:hypothetical protein